MSNIFIKSMYLAHNIENDNKGEGPIYATCTLGSKSSDATCNKNPPTSATFGATPTDFELRQFYQLHNTPVPQLFVVCLLKKLKANNEEQKELTMKKIGQSDALSHSDYLQIQ